jgi:multisubunit Na+/H+ antiporter MnhB subunit
VTTGFFLIWHAFEGIAIFALSLIVLAFSIKAKPKSIRICAVLGLVYVVVAGVGGLFFVLSGFTNNGNSAQMGMELHRRLRILLHGTLLRKIND